MTSEGTKNDAADAPNPDEHEHRDLLVASRLALDPALAVVAKEKRTAEDLAAMIRQDLEKLEGCPKRGVNVIIYGFNPWNSMLAFGVDAGPVLHKDDLRRLCDVITERLKRLYDVIDQL